MMLTRAALFQPVDLPCRVFATVPARVRETALTHGYHVEDDEPHGAMPDTKLRSLAFDTGPVPQLMIDREGILSLANERARAMLGIGPNDLGRPFQDLEISYRPSELRTPIEQALGQRRMITI